MKRYWIFEFSVAEKLWKEEIPRTAYCVVTVYGSELYPYCTDEKIAAYAVSRARQYLGKRKLELLHWTQGQLA